MPIQGISTREHIDPRFKTIGKLRKGGPKQGGRFGKDLDHFRFTSTDSFIVAAFHKAYTEEPNYLTVYLPYDQMERNFTSWRELYGQSGLVKIRCDGENWVDWIDGPRHHHGERPCTKEFKDPQNRCPGCPLQPVGRLSLILPELWQADYIGIVTLETHGWNDISHIASKLVQWEPLTGKPFTLWRENAKIGAPNEKTGKRMAVTKSLVYIELTADYLAKQFQAAQHRALAALEIPEIPAGNELDAYLAAAEEAEFETLNQPESKSALTFDDPTLEDSLPSEVQENELPEAEIATGSLPPYEPVPFPDALTWENDSFFASAIKLMGFEHIGKVKGALLATFGPRWETKATPRGAWAALNEHQASKVAK